MHYHRIPYTSLEISVFGLGTMTFGEQNNEADAHAQLDYAVSQGINLIDVAEIYPMPFRQETQGLAESYVGNWLTKRDNRKKMVIASKVSGPVLNNNYGIRHNQILDRKNIREALEASLRRLQTDYIDLYQIHWPQRKTSCFGKLDYGWINTTPIVSILETLEALAECQRAGKVRYIGVSNETAFGVMRYLHLADKHNLPRIVTIQNPYNLLNRNYELSLAEVSKHEGIELLACSCLASGALTGKHIGDAKFISTRNTIFGHFIRYNDTQAQKATIAYLNIAKRYDLDPAQMALAFVCRQPFVASVLLGVTTIGQLKTNIESLYLELNEEILSEIEAMYQLYTYFTP